MTRPFIPVNRPCLNGNEKKYLLECIETGWISAQGPFVSRFETEMAHRLGRRHGIAVSSGTAALDVAMAALKLEPGDEVILPTFTMIACAASIVRAGAIPVVVDAEADTWNMNVDAVRAAITPRTRAIMPVHIYGFPVDMAPLTTLAKQYGLAIIEDAAEALGQTYNGQPCGSFGDLSALSFYPNKHVTTGEGGMLLTDDDQLAARCRSLRDQCYLPHQRFVHEELGWNLRMSNLQAAVGVAQLEQLDQFLAFKRKMGAAYSAALEGLSTIQCPIASRNFAENSYWVYGVVLRDGAPETSQVLEALKANGVGTRPFFWPMHKQPALTERGWFKSLQLPVAERLATRGFYVPSGLGLTPAEQARVIEALTNILT